MPIQPSPHSCNLKLDDATTNDPQGIVDFFAQLGLVGASPALRAVFDQTYRAGPLSDSPVLIVGRSGTGKSRLAQAIRELDPRRRDKPFLTINCASVGRTLADSELFGQALGKSRAKSGLLRRASGGTLLLDEVSELDPELQPRLLCGLMDRQLLATGADHDCHADVRVLAIADRPLGPLVARGCFSGELFERLSRVCITIPPLRERPEDIAFQARHFLRLHRKPSAGAVDDFAPGLLEALQQLPWEGNTRQLENLVRETLARKGLGAIIDWQDLPQRVREILPQLPSLHALEGPAINDPMEDLLRKACEQRWTLRQAMKEVDRLLPFRPRA